MQIVMHNREQIIKEYFQLRILLNRSNNLANQKTEMVFEIQSRPNQEFVLVAKLKSDVIRGGLILAKKPKLKNWSAFGFTGLDSLEEYCSDLLMEVFDEFELLKSQEKLNQELRGLGIQKFD